MAIERGKKGPSLWVSHNKHGKITGPTCGILFFYQLICGFQSDSSFSQLTSAFLGWVETTN
jgi:hypothetical protein